MSQGGLPLIRYNLFLSRPVQVREGQCGSYRFGSICAFSAIGNDSSLGLSLCLVIREAILRTSGFPPVFRWVIPYISCPRKKGADFVSTDRSWCGFEWRWFSIYDRRHQESLQRTQSSLWRLHRGIFWKPLLINRSKKLRLDWECRVSETLWLDKSLLILNGKFNKNYAGRLNSRTDEWINLNGWALKKQGM